MASEATVRLEYGLLAKNSLDAVEYEPYEGSAVQMSIDKYKVVSVREANEAPGRLVFVLGSTNNGKSFNLLRDKEEFLLQNDQLDDRVRRSIVGAIFRVYLRAENDAKASLYYAVRVSDFIGQRAPDNSFLKRVSQRMLNTKPRWRYLLRNEGDRTTPVYVLYYVRSDDGGGNGGGQSDCALFHCNNPSEDERATCIALGCPVPA